MAQCIAHAGLLRNDENLRMAMKLPIETVLPGKLRQVALSMLDHIPSPSPAALSRWRFLIDAAFMMWTRAANVRDFNAGVKWVHWIMVDASPQGGRNYELAIVCSCRVDDLPEAMRLSTLLSSLSREVPSNEELESERKLISELRSLFHMHRPPPVVLGQGRSTTTNKFCALLHAMFLDTGGVYRCEVFRDFLRGILVPTTDFGDEYGIASISPLPVK